MAARLWTLLWAICVLACVCNVLSCGSCSSRPSPPKCPKTDEGKLSKDVRKLIYKYVYKRAPTRPNYSCSLEKDAAKVLSHHGRPEDNEDGKTYLSLMGPWRSSFIKDAIKWWSPQLKKMDGLKSVGCFYKADETDTGIGELTCAFESS
ncbi:hypothetical protein Y032_0081g1431 [Ancylostoma ceylanicum]|uniref:SCP domain-containing protein n=1 Tax=Ancylostoma ceylanicum TaxID=53326 RepID=A0A016TT60_9BILA|nr:hypothetical protein Y032_0081g1431 [Ancylostoma ceylanicum]